MVEEGALKLKEEIIALVKGTDVWTEDSETTLSNAEIDLVITQEDIASH